MFNDQIYVRVIGALTGIYFVIAMFDLFKYYVSMVFPQEKFFEGTIKNKF
jgi:hypothetical protein